MALSPILQRHTMFMSYMVEFHMALSHKKLHKTTCSLMVELIMALSYALSHTNTYKITIKQQHKTSPLGPVCFIPPKWLYQSHRWPGPGVQALQRDPWALRTKYKRMSDSHIAPRWDPTTGPAGMATWDGYRRRVIPMERSMTRVGTLYGKPTKNDGKSPFLMILMGKLTISMTIFNSKLLVYQRVSDPIIGRTCPFFTTLIGKWW